MKKTDNKLTRRNFLAKTGIATVGLTIVPNVVMGRKFGHISPSDKLNIAGVGIGGMGRNNLKNMNSQNIIALCDVDWDYADKTFKDYPNAKKYQDWRIMFDEIANRLML